MANRQVRVGLVLVGWLLFCSGAAQGFHVGHAEASHDSDHCPVCHVCHFAHTGVDLPDEAEAIAFDNPTVEEVCPDRSILSTVENTPIRHPRAPPGT